MKKLVIKNTHPVIAGATVFGVVAYLCVIWLFGGCGKVTEPQLQVQTEIINQRSVAVDNPEDFYLRAIRPISADSAVFTLANLRGSEVKIKVWRATSDSLGTGFQSIPWLQWLRCVDKWTNHCASRYSQNDAEFWKCVGTVGVGCAIGALWLEFAFGILTPWMYW